MAERGRSWRCSLLPPTTSERRSCSLRMPPSRDVNTWYLNHSRSGPNLTSTWQLFVKKSADGGITWDTAIPLTSEKVLVGGRQVFGADPLGFDNERPRIAALGNELGLVWERSVFGSSQPQIWSARLDPNAALTGTPEIVASDTPSRFAHVLMLKGQEYILYADGSKGTSRITLAQKGRTWQTQLLQNTDVLNAVFPHAVQFKNSLFIFWENQAASGGVSSLIQLRPLTSVGIPIVKPVDFTPGQPAQKTVSRSAGPSRSRPTRRASGNTATTGRTAMASPPWRRRRRRFPDLAREKRPCFQRGRWIGTGPGRFR